MNSDAFLSLYHQPSDDSIVYGLSLWKSDYDFVEKDKETGQTAYENLTFSLISIKRGKCTLDGLLALMQKESELYLDPSFDSPSALILEDAPSAKPFRQIGIKTRLIKRAGSADDQLAAIRQNIGKSIILGKFQIKPSLIFPNIGDNLIDPIRSDLTQQLPLTQSAIIAHHYFQKIYKAFEGILVSYQEPHRTPPRYNGF